MTIAALQPTELRAILSGGGEAMDALAKRIASTDGDISMELYQLADQATVDALVARGMRGDSVHVLGDTRLADGGYAYEIADATRNGGWRTYDTRGEFWQHAKTYHLHGPDGPETWLTNLAPIPDTHNRTELSLVLGGNASRAARRVTDATIDGDRSAIQGAIDAAASEGVLYNDPLAGRRVLADGLSGLLDARRADDLVVITKGVESQAMTTALIDAHQAGRNVQLYVRDIARADALQLDAAGVPTFVLGGGLKPRINAVFAGNDAIVGSAFLWDNMVGDPSVTTARDAGVLLSGRPASDVRHAALATVDAMPDHTPVGEALRAGALPEHI
jgi:hypothetical protein